MKLFRLLLPAVVALTCAACDVSFGSGPIDPSSAASYDAAVDAMHAAGTQTVVLSDGTLTQALPLGSGSGLQLVEPIGGGGPQMGTVLD